MKLIEPFTDEELFTKKHFPRTGTTNLGSYCISAASSHYDWAMKKIEKHILWLSIWEGFFKVSFFFTEKHLERITALDITDAIKEKFAKAKHTVRLIPMIFDINNKEQLEDLPTVVRFKKSLK